MLPSLAELGEFRKPADTALANRLANFIGQFGWERTTADTCRIGLGNTKHIANRTRAHARTRRSIGRGRVG